MPDAGKEPDGDGDRAPFPPTDVAGVDVQSVIGGLRSRLLGGRGPGATQQETARFMSERVTVGAVPTVTERELVAIRSGLARGDSDALSRDAERARDGLAETLDALSSRLAPRRLASRAIEAGRVRGALVLGIPADTGAAATAAAGLWWRVAGRAALAGAASTIGLGLLIRTARHRPRTTAPGRGRSS